MPKITPAEFKNRVHTANPLRYDLSMTSFTTTREHVSVFCIKGNHTFSQRPDKLMKGIGCSKCYGYVGVKETNEHFINKTNEKYGVNVYKFDKLNYVNAHTPVELYCSEHAGYFSIKPNHFLSKNSKGCNVCQKNTPYSTEDFIEKCKLLYGSKYSYESTVYVGQREKVIVYCNDHKGIVEVNPTTLLKNKTGCAICSGKVHSHDTFVASAKLVHGDKYDYSTDNYIRSDKKISIICIEHGSFSQTPKAHLSGRGCPDCGEYGYQPNKPGTFYIQKLSNTDKIVYKFGISGDLERRMREQKRNSIFEHEIIKVVNFENGLEALSLENLIKSTIPYGVLSKNELKSGFSETFNPEYLDIVLSLIEDA